MIILVKKDITCLKYNFLKCFSVYSPPKTDFPAAPENIEGVVDAVVEATEKEAGVQILKDNEDRTSEGVAGADVTIGDDVTLAGAAVVVT